MKSEAKVHNLLAKRYKRIQWEKTSLSISSSLLYSSFLFHVDTHKTLPPRQWNPRPRCTIYCWSVTKEYSERKPVSLYLHLYYIQLSYFIQTLTVLSLGDNKIGEKGAQCIGETLLRNTVRENQSPSLHLYHIHLSYFIQTLTSLDLANNRIQDKGAQSIGEALQKNTVRENQSFSLHLYHIHFYYFIQTLRDINLENNKIGDKWKQYLRELTKKNTNLSLYLWCKLKTLWEILFDSVWNKRNLIEPTESPLWKLLLDFLWRNLLKMFECVSKIG
jgi:hypothetical protein